MAGSKRIGIEKRKKAEEKAREDTVTEDEVEEFFAILRRIHVAVRYFKSAADGNGRRKLTAILEGESNEEISDVKGEKPKRRRRRREEEGVEENVGFDLNADPDPECDPL